MQNSNIKNSLFAIKPLNKPKIIFYFDINVKIFGQCYSYLSFKTKQKTQ